MRCKFFWLWPCASTWPYTHMPRSIRTVPSRGRLELEATAMVLQEQFAGVVFNQSGSHRSAPMMANGQYDDETYQKATARFEMLPEAIIGQAGEIPNQPHLKTTSELNEARKSLSRQQLLFKSCVKQLSPIRSELYFDENVYSAPNYLPPDGDLTVSTKTLWATS